MNEQPYQRDFIMQLEKLLIEVDLTIAAMTNPPDAWSSTPNHSSYEVSAEIHQDLQSATREAGSQSFNTASADHSNLPQSSMLD